MKWLLARYRVIDERGQFYYVIEPVATEAQEKAFRKKHEAATIEEQTSESR